MRVQIAAILLAAALLGACHKKPTEPAGPTTGDGIPLSDIDNGLANNSVTNVDEPDTEIAND